jgi:hypothetical protein
VWDTMPWRDRAVMCYHVAWGSMPCRGWIPCGNPCRGGIPFCAKLVPAVCGTIPVGISCSAGSGLLDDDATGDAALTVRLLRQSCVACCVFCIPFAARCMLRCMRRPRRPFRFDLIIAITHRTAAYARLRRQHAQRRPGVCASVHTSMHARRREPAWHLLMFVDDAAQDPPVSCCAVGWSSKSR